MDSWHYHDGAQQRGPVSKVDILALRKEGKIGPDTLVWSQGMDEWKPVGKVPELEVSTVQPALPDRQSPVSPYAPPVSASEVNVDWEDYTPTGPQVRPWVRYWARTFDFLFFSILVGAVAGVLSPGMVKGMPETILGFVILFAYCFVEPLMLATFGTTPFKALLRVRMRNGDGSKLSYLQALRRTFSVLLFGQGLGIPLVALIMCITSYSRLTNKGITRWDASGSFVVSHQTVQGWRCLILVVGFAGFVVLVVLGKTA
jgi:hypothetical protein